jgi:uncharacterized SAM-binding protein YcdF (DUF218 family)
VKLPRRSKLRRFAVRGALLLAAATLAFMSRARWLTKAAEFLDASNPPARADFMLVLGGGRETRPFVAAAWVTRGRASAVLVPTVQTPPELVDGTILPDHEVVRRVLLAQGVPSEAIEVLPGECATTRDEANALAAYLDSHPNVSVAVVTNSLYTRRARSIMYGRLGKQASRVFFVGAPSDHFDETNWWKSEEGFQSYTTEYLKLVAHWLTF